MTNHHAKLEKVADIGGYDDDDQLFECSALDSCVPPICVEQRCDHSADLDPDQDKGWCESCEKPSMKSAHFIAGFI
jgi:hypothetical protein